MILWPRLMERIARSDGLSMQCRSEFRNAGHAAFTRFAAGKNEVFIGEYEQLVVDAAQLLRNVASLPADARAGSQERLSRKKAITPPIGDSAGHLSWSVKNPDRLLTKIYNVIVSQTHVDTLIFRGLVRDYSRSHGPELLQGGLEGGIREVGKKDITQRHPAFCQK